MILKTVLDHSAPNKLHPETGIYLLWSLSKTGEREDILDWELYSPDVFRGQSQTVAYDRIRGTAAQFRAVMTVGRGF